MPVILPGREPLATTQRSGIFYLSVSFLPILVLVGTMLTVLFGMSNLTKREVRQEKNATAFFDLLSVTVLETLAQYMPVCSSGCRTSLRVR